MTASLNEVRLIGNLGAAAVVRRTSSGHVVAHLNLCTNYRRGDIDHVEWHRVVLWNDLAERAEKYLRKGMSIYVAGRLQTRKWKDDDGVERWNTEIVADAFQMLGSRKPENEGSSDTDLPPAEEGGNAPTLPPGLDDVPF